MPEPAVPPTVAEMLTALRALHYNYSYGQTIREEWAFFEELRLGTGFTQEQRIDAFALALWPSKHWASYAYEVKASRTDFKSEIRKPAKRRAALRYSNLFWFVTPVGLVKPEEIPIEAGLIEICWRAGWSSRLGCSIEDWRPHVVLSAPWRDVPPPTWNLFAAVARRVSRQEQANADN